MTPAMQQFHEIKATYNDHIVLFRMGDFFETFYDDAKVASQILGITLTARDKERKVPMAGIPFHALDNYLSKLVEANQKVVIVEQLEDPKEAKGVVKRGVVKVVTPGTSTLEKDLKNNNYLVSVYKLKENFHLSFVDVIEGIIYIIKFDNQRDFENNLQILNSKEILFPSSVKTAELLTKETITRISLFINQIDENNFNEIKDVDRYQKEIIDEVKKLNSPAIFSLLNYLAETQRTDLHHITDVREITKNDTMNLDINAVRNLELIDGMREKSLSLFNLLDKCKTTSGSKKLKTWIIAPLLKKENIDNRLRSISSLIELGQGKIDEIHNLFSELHDLNRISSKIGLRTANARDLRNAVETIKAIFSIKNELKNNSLSPRIEEISNEIDRNIKLSQSVLAEVDRIIKEDPPLTVREGGMIKSGIDEDLDKLHDLKTGGKDWLKSFEKEEIARSKIPTLKVRFNKVFGYYIEVSKGQSAKVPDYFIRKQTLVNAERYITPELKEQESNILGAEDRIKKIEYDIFTNLLDKLETIIPFLQKLNDLVSELDIYHSFTTVALEYNWVRPEILEDDSLIIQNGRHPVIEYLLLKQGKSFVKNSVCLSADCSLQIITGPNMGGKSTFIRQIALITLLAQIGSYVPADKAEIGIVDKIFTRVGASDNLSQGESTFMVEMLETSEILKSATSKSLIILDEIGRGTSTFDGMSIAWAICEHIQNIGAKSLFATHYHELTELANKYKNVKNLSVKVVDYNGEIIFMHQIQDGRADKSYGIHVAKLAGLPKTVIKKSEEILKMLEKEKNTLQPKPRDLFAENAEEVPNPKSQIPNANIIMEELQNIDTNTMTPLEALQKLGEWKLKIKE